MQARSPLAWLTISARFYPEPDRSDDEVRRLRKVDYGLSHGEFKEKMDRMILGSMKDTTQGRPIGHGDRDGNFRGWRPVISRTTTMQTIWILDEFTEKRGGTALYRDPLLKRVQNCGPGDDDGLRFW